LGEDAYVVELSVRGKGSNDCAAPRFTGFQVAGTVLIAQIERQPTTETCLIINNIAFDVLLDRRSIPSTATRLQLTESCGGDRPGCAGNPVPIEPFNGEPVDPEGSGDAPSGS
jgi:hypothetical protein